MTNRSKWFIFALVALAQCMVLIDSSITNVALASIQANLHFSADTLQWIVTAYALTFGGFLLVGGRAADQFGRRRVLQVGTAIFVLCSLGIGLSQTPLQIIVLRAVQGAAAAFMSPAALSIVLAIFPDGDDRRRALGRWTSISTVGAALGLLLGGFLTQVIDWRWNFFINLPIGLILLIFVQRMVPEHEHETRNRRVDIKGALLITLSLVSFVFAVSQIPSWGWVSAGTLGMFVLAVVSLALFIRVEKRSSSPLVPLSLFRIRNVTAANIIMAPVYAGIMGNFLIASLYMQSVLHFTPLQTGLGFVPFPLMVAFVSSQAPKLVGKYGPKPFIIIGPIIIALAALLFSQTPVAGSYLMNILPTFILMPIGIGLTLTPIYAAATSGVPVGESGIASGIINTAQQMGGALGLTILTDIAVTVTTHSANLGTSAALVHGYNVAYQVMAGFMIAASLLAAVLIKQPRRQKTSETSKDHVAA